MTCTASRHVRQTALMQIRAFSQTRSCMAPNPILYRVLAQNLRSTKPPWKIPLVRYSTGVARVGGTGYYVSHLEHVAITNRSRFMTVSAEQEAEVSKQAYGRIMTQFGDRILPDSYSETKFVKKVAGPLIHASGLKDLDWEVHVIKSPEAVSS